MNFLNSSIQRVLGTFNTSQKCYLCKNRLDILVFVAWIFGVPILSGYFSRLLFGIISASKNKEYDFTTYWSSIFGWGVFLVLLTIVVVFKIIIPVNTSCKDFINKNCHKNSQSTNVER
jgi:hypothetical protein